MSDENTWTNTRNEREREKKQWMNKMCVKTIQKRNLMKTQKRQVSIECRLAVRAKKPPETFDSVIDDGDDDDDLIWHKTVNNTLTIKRDKIYKNNTHTHSFEWKKKCSLCTKLTYVMCANDRRKKLPQMKNNKRKIRRRILWLHCSNYIEQSALINSQNTIKSLCRLQKVFAAHQMIG